ncbi:MAG: universal stress protein [Gammaproteobacteria bacterium]|nr:universal stress protein [Gammaproteobacteria bacterium]
MNPKKILCASHGTPGARAAETAALAFCNEGTALHHLFVVPDFWKGMMGDDWLNNAVTRERYGNYVEGLLEGEEAETVERLGQAVTGRGAAYSYETQVGKPADCLLEAGRRDGCDLIIIGSPRPKGMEGLRSHMDLGLLVRQLEIPLLIIPHPGS